MNRWMLVLAVWSATSACSAPVCATGRYSDPECRVVMDYEVAQLATPNGLHVQFVDPDTRQWAPLGRLRWDDGVQARVSGLGGFALRIDASQANDAGVARFELRNIDATTQVTVEPDVATVEPDEQDPHVRRVQVNLATLPANKQLMVVGQPMCNEAFALALVADVQTNPVQFERIVSAINLDVHRQVAPVRGVVMAGDLAESASLPEFETIAEIFSRLEVPVAVTAGNHDVYRARDYFHRIFGPSTYGFELCGVHVALFDSGSGAIAESVQGRLPELLAKGSARHSLAVVHHPPYAALTAAGWSSEAAAANFLVEAVLAEVDLVVTGHVHALRDAPDVPVGDARVHQVIAGTGGAYQGMGAPIYGYVRVTFGQNLQLCFREVSTSGGTDRNHGQASRGGNIEFCGDNDDGS